MKKEYLLIHLSTLLNTGIFLLNKDGMVSYQKSFQSNPLFHNELLKNRLIDLTKKQELPVIWKDEYQVYFACIETEQGYYLVGPMCTENFNRLGMHRFYQFHGISQNLEKNLRRFTMIEILQMVCTLTHVVSGNEYSDQQLADANAMMLVTKNQENIESIRFDLKSEEEDMYRHSYQEECHLLDMVMEGNVEAAVRLSREMDMEIGRLGFNELTHWQNVLVVGATLCARAAIKSGVTPYIAYRISGFYINKGSACKDIVQILTYRNHCVEELAKRVRELHTKRHVSSYIEQCKDYVRKHYREKIYLNEIANILGISSSYLSRLFKKETGICLQDYINEIRVERAANLLIYSEESLPEIAEYINFPSQSYFGKIFKQKKNMTPRQYRELYKPKEFIEKK